MGSGGLLRLWRALTTLCRHETLGRKMTGSAAGTLRRGAGDQGLKVKQRMVMQPTICDLIVDVQSKKGLMTA